MSEEKIYNEKPNGLDANENEVLNSNELYSIPNEEACSAEFAEGCIKNNGDQEK